MATTKKKTKSKSKKPKQTLLARAWLVICKPYYAIKRRVKNLLNRRPHRSFRRTLRRDYVRSLQLPGYWAFTNEVRKTLCKNKKLFIGLAVIYGILTVALVGMASEEKYTELTDALQDIGTEILDGDLGKFGDAGLLLLSGMNGSLNIAPTELQRFYAVILALLIWLATLWLLRSILAGRKPKLRDGLYNSGSPFIPTFLVACVMAVQMLPVALAAVAFSAATASKLLDSGVEAMIFWIGASMLGALSLYWITSTFIALVVVTLPGMYPMKALKIAGDLVIGRRIRILFRLLWLIALTILVWAIIMIPIILLDLWIKDIWPAIHWIPIVPVVLLVMGSTIVIWLSSYIYLLYRKIVDDDAAPA